MEYMKIDVFLFCANNGTIYQTSFFLIRPNKMVLLKGNRYILDHKP